jgi:hypothetical protein
MHWATYSLNDFLMLGTFKIYNRLVLSQIYVRVLNKYNLCMKEAIIYRLIASAVRPLKVQVSHGMLRSGLELG